MSDFKSKANVVLDQAKTLFGEKADALAKQPEKLKQVLGKVAEKIRDLSHNPKVQKLIEPISIFIRMIKAHFNGSHKVSGGTLGLIVLGLVYFISPVDIIPDFLGFFGYADDLSVILAIFARLKDEVEEFLDWERTS